MTQAISFGEWMKEVDRRLEKLLGLDHRSLGDAPYHDNFSGEPLTDEDWEELAYVILVEYNDMDEATFTNLMDGDV